MEKIEEKVEMKDGVKLATDVYLPKKEGKYPTLLIMTPYGKEQMKTFVRTFVESDYSLVIQDVRGRYDSEGSFDPINQEKTDGLETVDWIKEQNWYDPAAGIGIVGISYLSTCAIPAAAKKESIKAMINVGGFSNTYDLTHRGGAKVLHHSLPWSIIISYSPQPDLSKIDWKEVYRTEPLKDAAKKAGYPNELWSAWCEHPLRDDYWKKLSVEEYLEEVDIPILHMSGWYDLCLGNTLDLYQYFEERSSKPQHLVIGPWTHNGVFMGPTELHELDFGEQSRPGTIENVISWFDRWLKDKDMSKDNLSTDKRPISVFITGENKWYHSKRWPPEDVDEKHLYISPDGLSFDKDQEETTEIEINIDRDDPVPTIGGRVWEFPTADLDPGPALQNALHARHDILLFETEYLERDIGILGKVEVNLFLSVTDESTDINCKLLDIDEEGDKRIIAEGINRLNISDDCTENLTLDKDKVIGCEVDLWDIAHVFKKGHKIGLEISWSNFPNWDRSLSDGKIKIYTGKDHRSMLHLDSVELG